MHGEQVRVAAKVPDGGRQHGVHVGVVGVLAVGLTCRNFTFEDVVSRKWRREALLWWE